MTHPQLIDLLSNELSLPLPGRAAQYKMAHAVRGGYKPPPENTRIACVLVLIYPHQNQPHLVLIERMSNVERDRHSGQISFPGGKYEDSDGSLQNAAVREAEEEVGVPKDAVQLIGKLTDLYIPVSNFLVHPFVGYANSRPVFSPQPSEVQSILEVPIAHLQNPETIRKTHLKVTKNIVLQNVPYFDVEDKILWGATAMITNELLEVIKRGNGNQALGE